MRADSQIYPPQNTFPFLLLLLSCLFRQTIPADIYHLYLMACQIDLPLKSITLNLGNVHIYENNIDRTKLLLAGDENVRFADYKNNEDQNESE